MSLNHCLGDCFSPKIYFLTYLSSQTCLAGLITQVMTTCLLSRGAYVGVLSSWSLAQCRSLDKLFARAYRSRTRNISSSQEENLFQPASVGGLGFNRPSVLIQERKQSLARRAACSDDCYTRFAIDALQRRGHPYPYNVHQPCVSLDRPRSGFWISSLIEYGDSASATLICQLTPPSADLFPTTPLFGVSPTWSGLLSSPRILNYMTVTSSWTWPNGMRRFLPGAGKSFLTFFSPSLAASLFGNRVLFRSFPVERGTSLMANFSVLPRGLLKSYPFLPAPFLPWSILSFGNGNFLIQ